MGKENRISAFSQRGDYPIDGSLALKSTVTDRSYLKSVLSTDELRARNISSIGRYNGKREVVGSKAFNLEYLKGYTDEELKDDLISYLGEYRLRVQRYDYEMQCFEDPVHGFKLRDVHRGEPLSIKAERAIIERKARGEPVSREEAELEGVLSTENQVHFARLGDSIVWASPPGPKSQGYGDYGFIYSGVIDKKDAKFTHLSMTAIKVDSPTIEQFNNFFSNLLSKKVSYSTGEDFIAFPVVLNNRTTADIESLIAQSFTFSKDNLDQDSFKKIIAKLAPLKEEFVKVIRNGTKEERIEALHAIENYTLELKERFSHKAHEKIIYLDDHRTLGFKQMVSLYGKYEPPKASGSCGSTEDSAKSNDILRNGYDRLMAAISGKDILKKDSEKEGFTCPRCGYKTKDKVGNICPKDKGGCGLTKEEYAKKKGAKICD